MAMSHLESNINSNLESDVLFSLKILTLTNDIIQLFVENKTTCIISGVFKRRKTSYKIIYLMVTTGNF
jgi:hypothetical protein